MSLYFLFIQQCNQNSPSIRNRIVSSTEPSVLSALQIYVPPSSFTTVSNTTESSPTEMRLLGTRAWPFLYQETTGVGVALATHWREAVSPSLIVTRGADVSINLGGPAMKQQNMHMKEIKLDVLQDRNNTNGLKNNIAVCCEHHTCCIVWILTQSHNPLFSLWFNKTIESTT